MMSNSVASYDQLVRQVEDLRKENSHLRRELEDNSHHLSKLENETSDMKVSSNFRGVHSPYICVIIYVYPQIPPKKVYNLVNRARWKNKLGPNEFCVAFWLQFRD